MASSSQTVERATTAEKQSLAETFVSLCEIASPTGSESLVARKVRAELEQLGLSVEEDDTAAETGADCGNLLARIDGPEGAPSVMMCAHLDTVPLTDTIEVELEEGAFVNSRDAILGADNKAAVALMVELARRFAVNPPPAGIELLFTTSEETGLRGAKAFDVSKLRSAFGYAFDHPSPIGELILAAPTYYRVAADFHGVAAHAGIAPERGHNAVAAAARAIAALELGRIDEQTTSNIGRIEGGSATNVVAERCFFDAEVRSLDHAIATERTQRVVDTLTSVGSESEVDVDTTVEEQFRAYRLSEGETVVRVAADALRDCGVEPVFRTSGGGSDVNAFQLKGFDCLNLANGTEANHTPDERVSVAALEQMFDVALCLVARAAEG